MASVTLPVPSVVGGVSQRPEHLSDPDKFRDLLNFLPFPEVGLVKRPHTSYRGKVFGNPFPETSLVPVDIGGNDKYVLALAHKQVKAFLRTGDEVPIYQVTRDADGNPIAGAAPGLDYLDLRTPNLIDEPEQLISSGGPWVITGQATNTVIGTGPAAPLGFPDDGTDSHEFSELKLAGTGTSPGSWVQLITAHLSKGLRSFSVYVNTEMTGGATRDANADTVQLDLADPANGSLFGVAWSFGGDFTSPPTPTLVGNDTIVPFTEQIDTYTFRLGFVVDGDKLTATPTSNSLNVSIRLSLDSTSEVRGMWAWGAQLGLGGELFELPPYVQPPESLRIVQAGGTSYIANPLVATRMNGFESTDFGDVYGTTTFPGVGGGSDETGVTIADAGYIFVRQYGNDLNYGWTVRVTDTTGSGGTVTLSDTEQSAADGTVEDAKDIAVDIRDGINNHASNTDGGTGGNEAQIVLATGVGSVVKIETKQKDGETWVIDEIQVRDPLGGSAMVQWHDEIESLSDLPLIAQDDTRVRVVADDADPSEYQAAQVIARFVAEDSGEFGAGHWEEGTEYGVRIGLFDDTLPHKLVRREDNSVGTVTGQSRAIYFEWAAHTWTDRLVGDNVTNPIPSFITPPVDEGLRDRFITAIGFYRGRLVLASSAQTIVFSGASVLENYWRSTVRALPDSDRIDIESGSAMTSPIFGIVTGNGRLFFVARRGIQVASFSGGILSGKTIGLDTVYSGRSNELATPVPARNGFIFSQGGTQYDNVRFLSDRGDNTFADTDLSEDAPRWVRSPLATLSWAPEVNLLFTHSREERARVGVLRFSPDGIAWSRIEFTNGSSDADGEVESVVALDDALFVLLERADGIHLESISLDYTQFDEDQSWSALLDRRITDKHLKVDPLLSGSNTKYNLPYDLEEGVTPTVVPRSGSTFGVPFTVITVSRTIPGSHFIEVEGDHTTVPVYIGQTYRAYAKPVRPVIKERSLFGGAVPRASTEISVGSGVVYLQDSAYLDVLVRNPDGTTLPSGPGVAPEVDGEGAAAVTLSDDAVRFAVASELEEFEVTLQNDTHKPSNITGLEWNLEAVDLGERVRF